MRTDNAIGFNGIFLSRQRFDGEVIHLKLLSSVWAKDHFGIGIVCIYLTRYNLKNVIDIFCIKFAFDVVRRAYVAHSIDFVARKARIVWIWQWPRDILEKNFNQQISIVSCVRYLDWLQSPFDILIQCSSMRTAREKHTILLSVNRVPLFLDYIIISYFVVAHLAVEKLSRQILNISVGKRIGIELWIYLPRWAN